MGIFDAESLRITQQWAEAQPVKLAQLRKAMEDSTSKLWLKRAVPDWPALAIIVVFALYFLIGAFAGISLHVERNYNEGWNAYNAETAAHHLPLYPSKYGWTTVNYPIVSFYVVGSLSHFFGDPVLVGRVLSMASIFISSVLVALIVKKLTQNGCAAIFGACFCLDIFCTAASGYVGMNDPQMFAQMFVLSGLLLYLGENSRSGLILAATTLFVLGGNIKQNLIAAPLAVLIDLLLRSRTKAIRFVLFAVLLVCASIVINTIVGGPFFVAKLLAPRSYSVVSVLRCLPIYETLQIPLTISLIWSVWQISDRKFRSIALYFFASLSVGVAFGGGAGVGVNTYFENFLAMSIIMGLFLDSVWKMPVARFEKGRLGRWAPPLLLSIAAPFMWRESPYFNLHKYLTRLPAEERLFNSEVSFLAARPGPAICESLLRCYYSGKPFVFDPFNSTNLVDLGKLNGQEMVQRIAAKEFGAIQTYIPVTEMERPAEFFPDGMLDAIDRYYEISWRDPDCIIYVPRRTAK
jgi:hypothetical protein